MVEDFWVRWRTINWNVRESEIFLSLCVSILHVISIDESSSLWNISRKQIFRVLKNSFLSLCVSILHVISIDESSSLWNISRKQIFRVLKNSFWHSRGILVVSCETLRWAALLVDGPRDFFVKQWSVGGWACYILDNFKRFSRRSPTNKHYTTTVNRQKWEIDMGFWLVSLLTFYLLFLLLLQWKIRRRR